MSYKKYYVYKKQYTTDGVTWADVTPVEWTPSGDPIGTYNTFEQCGENPPQYRKRCDGNYYCNGYDKYINTITEISFDNGSTWEPAYSSGSTLVERNCSDCISGIKVLTQSNCGNTLTTNCGGTSALLNDDIPYVQSTSFEQYTSHTIGNCVTSIVPDTLSHGVTRFRNRNLKVCHLPSTISTLPSGLFKGSGLEDFTIPSSITTIGDAVFSACTSLQSLKVLATTPPTIGSNVFDGTNIGQIYVPSESVEAYKAASGWSDYADKIFAIADTCYARYRYVNECWVCQGYDKYHKAKQQISYDGGETWTDTGIVSAMTLEEANSFTCGYGASNPTSHHYYAEYSDGTRYAYDTDCDYTLTYAEANPDCYNPREMTYAYIGGCYDYIEGGFSNHTSLSSVTMSNSVRSIGVYAFYQCNSLTSVTIPSGVVYIHDGAFKDCTSLQYVRVEATNPPSADTIFYGMFDNTNNCPIYVPSGSVQSYKTASHWSRYADRIQAPPSVTLYRWVESGWTCVGYDKYVNNIQQVSYDSGFTWENTSNTSASTLIETNSQDCGYLPSNVKYYFVASGDRYSGECDYNTTLSGVSYYSGVTLQAFIGECVTTIGDGCFEGFTNLNKVSISNSVTTIGRVAFASCQSLTSCTIGNSVTSIDDSAFGGCTSLKRVNSDVDGVFNIPSGVTSIGNGTFGGCTSLTSCTVGSGVTTIGGFSNCSNLKRLNSETDGVFNIPSGVTSIGNGTFGGCTSLTSCTVGSGVTTIGGFSNCSNLKRLNSETDGVFNIPSGATSIGESGFTSCSRLTSIDIPNNVTTIGGAAFAYCQALTSCTIGSGVTSIGYDAFYDCEGLTSVTIPNNVTSIGESAFFFCNHLTSIVIPSGVTSIGKYAFNYCSSLTSITVNATTPPTLRGNIFTSTNDCPIYVPAASVETYKTANYWSTYADRIQAIP